MKNKFYLGLIMALTLILSLGLAACGGEVTPTPSVGAAIATAVPTTILPATVTLASVTTVTSSIVTVTAAPPTPTARPATPALTTPVPTAVPATPAAPAPTAPLTKEPAPGATLAASAVVATGSPRLAYVETKTGSPGRGGTVTGGSLYTIDIASKTKKLLIQGGQRGVIGSPAWSPDNKFIAVAIRPDIQVANNQTSLFMVNADTGESKALLKDQPATASDSEPLWSPDGTTIAFTRLLVSAGTTTFEPTRSKSEVWLVDANGQNPRKLASGLQPAWSPDSRRIAFVTEGKIKPNGLSMPQDNALHLINAKGQNEWEPINTAKIPTDWTKYNYPFSGEAYFIQYPVFLEGGKTVGFTTIGATGLALTINSTTGSDIKMWGGQPEGGFGRTYSQPKGGSLMLFEGLPPSGARVFSIVDVSKTLPGDKALIPLQTFGGPPPNKKDAVLPAWSPDGKQVAYWSASPPFEGDYMGSTGPLIIGKIGTTEISEMTQGTISGLAWSN